MTALTRTLRLAAPAVLLLGLPPARVEEPAPPFEWRTEPAEARGMSAAKLEALEKALGERRTQVFLVVRNDRIVREWYAPGRDASAGHYTASLAKAVAGGLALAVVLGDRRIALDDPVSRYVPAWKDDSRKSRITIRHLGSHTSGLEDAEEGGLPHESLSGWKGDFWKRLDPPSDPFTISRDRAPVLFEPGAEFRYSNPGIAMLSYAITESLREAPLRDIRSLLRDRVMRPIGAGDGEWTLGYGATYTVDGLPIVATWGGGNYTARALARVGRLLARGGDWDGKPILDREAVRLVTTDAGTPGICGMGWWSNGEGKYADVPRDAFWGTGAGHQVLFVVPSLGLVAVRSGEVLDRDAEHNDALHERLFAPLITAVIRDSTPGTAGGSYPPSPVIERIDWAPRETIARAARGSDNWPLTWLRSGDLIGAYGDGTGFEPGVPEKLSLGLARISGGPAGFTGVNLRSATAEQAGDGPSGGKASGLLMVDGVLHMWVRNVGNARLAWSEDEGATWAWSDWKLERSFGHPTFLQVGRDHAGARDEFVYVYSPDSDSAYTPADGIVLARAHRTRLRDREAYELFAGLEGGLPVWTRDIEKRSAIFTDPKRCYRPAVSYCAALDRYLLVRPLPGPSSIDDAGRADTRFAGGLAIHDAPHPWGPWTTAFLADSWDVGPGDAASFPPKWMSGDGASMRLVFSGDDCFSVREARISTRGAPGEAWRRIRPFFRPPPGLEENPGSYRSPLRFADGSTVTSAAAWERRRSEIRREWHDLMGPWPEVIQEPKLEVLEETRREGLSQMRVRLETAPGQTGDGWLLVPPGGGPFPAVLVVYYEPETSIGANPKQPMVAFALELSRRGFVTLSIGTPGGDARKPDTASAVCQPLSFHAYVAANCWNALANMKAIDRKRIGVVGHSYGGKWALFAAALWDGFACVAVSDPGVAFDETRPNVNYWEPWYLGLERERTRKPGVPSADNPRAGAYARMVAEGRDLHEIHALIAPRPFLVSGGPEDPPSRWTALNHAVQVNRLLGFEERVGLTQREGHTPTEESNAQLVAFFEHFLGSAAAEDGR